MTSESPLHIPPSTSTVQVFIIDTTFDARLPAAFFIGPTIPGFEESHGVAYAFLVKHTDLSGKERCIIFDLGCPKDMVNDFPPRIAQTIKDLGGYMRVDKHVSEILEDNGVTLNSIEAIIWSHADLDHIGRPSLFPASTALVVGPGIKESFFPGYPTVQESPVLEREFAGRDVEELALSRFDLEIGGLKALDYFGDGSFYLLSAPGHATGHLNALARTTEDTFVYFAGDTTHHLSELRPHSGSRLPELVHMPGHSCPGAAFHAIHPASDFSRVAEYYRTPLRYPSRTPDEVPFHTVSQKPTGESLSLNLQEARDTIEAVQRLDSDPNVFVVAAHDTSLQGILDFFPSRANDWKEKGLKEKGHWLFLQDFDGALRG
ncbi:hypothetical protein N7445_006736 [Penicillium cf. griseofulvum]|nr:hypothetical protein N7445_006736 [Penicillium cf. griseofulvum]